MIIKEVPYPVNGKKKYSVLHNGKEYTCYIHPFMSPGYTVCTGNGQDETCKDITETRLASEIFLHCQQKGYFKGGIQNEDIQSILQNRKWKRKFYFH